MDGLLLTIGVIIFLNLLYTIFLYFALQTNILFFRSNDYKIPFGKPEGTQKKGALMNPYIRYWRCDNPTQIEDRWVILFHSWGRNSARMIDAARIYWTRGFSLLFVDALAHGQSEWKTESTALWFAQYAKQALQQEEITATPFVHGLSFGAIAATVYANKFEAKALVAEALMTHPYKMMQDFLRRLHTPKIYYFVVNLVWKRTLPNFSWEDVTICNILPNIHIPIFLIHGAQDSLFHVDEHFTPNWNIIKNRPNTRSWVVPNSEHSKMHLHPDFSQKVGDFVNFCLLQ